MSLDLATHNIISSYDQMHYIPNELFVILSEDETNRPFHHILTTMNTTEGDILESLIQDVRNAEQFSPLKMLHIMPYTIKTLTKEIIYDFKKWLCKWNYTLTESSKRDTILWSISWRFK